jgi:hypothetical protein
MYNEPFTAGGDCDRLYWAATDCPLSVTLELNSTIEAGFKDSSLGFVIVTLISWFGAEPINCRLTIGWGTNE